MMKPFYKHGLKKNAHILHGELDLATYSIKVIKPPAFDSPEFLISLQILGRRSYFNYQSETIDIKIFFPDKNTCCLQTRDLRIILNFAWLNDWHRFWDSLWLEMIDLLVSKVLFPLETEDILWVEQSSADRVWILSLSRQTNGYWLGQLVERDRLKDIDIWYCFMGQPAQQRQNIEKLFEKFCKWLGTHTLLADNHPDFGQRRLTIKVHPAELWFLRFPLSVFCQLQYQGFTNYEDVEWIVTHKKFIQNCSERAQIQQELAHLPTLLERSVIVINTYNDHDALCNVGTDLIIEILSFLQEVQFDEGKFSLRWYLNPPSDVIKQVLKDTRTAYFFADFEASSGQWELGHGPYQCWQDNGSFCLQAAKGQPQGRYFLFEDEQYDLSHIRLMRVFHCNSIFDPYQSWDGREPADHHSIVRRLLNAGVQRVEGGMTEETYFDFLCSLIYLFFKAEHLRFIFCSKHLERALNFQSFMARINEFLVACHRNPIPFSETRE